MLTEIEHVGTAEQLPRLPGQDHLSAVCRGGDARALVDGEADVALARSFGFAAVDTHPHADWASSERSLGLGRGGGGIARRAERDEERVALRVDLGAPVRTEGGPQETAMPGEQLGVAVWRLTQESCRSFDVREEKRQPQTVPTP